MATIGRSPAKKITTLAGTLFFIWLFFTPIISLLILSQLFQDFNGLTLILTVLLGYIVLGLIYYRICQYFGGVYAKPDDKLILLPDTEYPRSVRYRGLLELLELAIFVSVLFSPRLILKLGLGTISPVLLGVVGLIIFISTCLANWYPPLRKKVNYWLSFGEKNEAVAYAQAEGTLYALNGLLIVISGFLMIICSLYLFP